MSAMKTIAVVTVAAMALMAGSTENVHGNGFGKPNAPVLIEVFSDFQCPGCKAFHDSDFPKIMTDYVVPGKVYLVYRYFPLQMHTYGRICAEYVCAAARVGRYQKVADAVFAQQQAITNTGKVEEVVSAVLTPTEMKQVKALLKSPEVQQEIDRDYLEGTPVVKSTPTLWVTSKGKSEPVSWPLNYSLFKQYIDTLLKK